MMSSLPLRATEEPIDERGGKAVPAVELVQVSRLYGGFAALREVSLQLPVGASAVLLGENGAGKSTLLKVVAGLESPTYGQVRVLGEPTEYVHERVAYMGHATMLYDDLTGRENLEYFAGLYGLSSAAARVAAIEALAGVGLETAAEKRVGAYSQGMRQRASLARVLMSQPELLLLDEPFSNLDVASAQAMIARLLGYVREGTARTLLLTTHQAELARPLAQMTVTMQAGRIARVE
jgi:ABC-type multidrug transport system ATPase subunit